MTTALLGFRPALVAPGRSAGFAGARHPLRKSVLLRQAAAEPSLVPPQQPAVQQQQAALGGMRAHNSWSLPAMSSWQGKLLYAGSSLLSAAISSRAGDLSHGGLGVVIALLILLIPS
ncbi:hypothetical protein ABPG75_005767 [Micractinium tetrahymenae]